jgi:hypothetical protein
MAIVETKIVSRPNTSTLFFDDTTSDLLTQVRSAVGYTVTENSPTQAMAATADGNIVKIRTYNNDGLTQSTTVTFASLSEFSLVDNATSIELDKEYFSYAEANGLTHPSSGQYTLTGIDAPFSCTTTYTYNSNIEDAFFNNFTATLEVSDKLTSFTNTGTQLIAVHTYTNATDFTNNHWRDNSFVNYLNENGVTRTIEYALVSNDA